MMPRETQDANAGDQPEFGSPPGSVASIWRRTQYLGMLTAATAIIGPVIFFLSRVNLLVLPPYFALLIGMAVYTGLTCRCPHCGASLWVGVQRAEFCPSCGGR